MPELRERGVLAAEPQRAVALLRNFREQTLQGDRRASGAVGTLVDSRGAAPTDQVQDPVSIRYFCADLGLRSECGHIRRVDTARREVT